MSRSERLAQAALSLVGTRYRLHGRDPVTGLDCVGLLAASLDCIGSKALLPNGYTLRSRRLAGLAEIADRAGLYEVDDGIAAGHVLLLRCSPVQHHLVIATSDACCVHAHAGLRRVVRTPIPAEWPVAGHWQLAPNPEE